MDTFNRNITSSVLFYALVWLKCLRLHERKHESITRFLFTYADLVFFRFVQRTTDSHSSSVRSGKITERYLRKVSVPLSDVVHDWFSHAEIKKKQIWYVHDNLFRSMSNDIVSSHHVLIVLSALLTYAAGHTFSGTLTQPV